MRMFAYDPHDLPVVAAESLRAVADPLRLRLLLALAAEGEICVCRLVSLLDEPQPKISQHLRVLRTADLVASRREGAWAHYRLTPPDNPIKEWIHGLLDHLRASDPLAPGTPPASADALDPPRISATSRGS